MIRKAAGLVWMGLGGLLLVGLGLAVQRSALVAPAPSVMLHDRHGAYLGEVGVPEDERLGFWPPGDTLPHRITAATLAIEDRRFHEHPGVDPQAVVRAASQNLRSGDRISGASTLAMQVARLQSPGPRTWPRKALEALTATVLVARHGREALLRQYLTLAPYGNNVHGARYAARRLFDKPLDDLTWAEAALLAGLPQAPGAMNPYREDGRRRAVARAGRVLDQLLLQGTLEPLDHQIAVEELENLRPLERPSRPSATLHALLALDGVPSEEPERRTTLDLALQEELDALLVDAVVRWRPRGAEQAAVVVLDRDTLAVRASVGSIGFEGTLAGSIDYTRTPRTPGSTLKPFVYARALDRGVLSPDRILDDLQQGIGGVRNADDDFLGPLLPRLALANSRNVPAVELASELGLDGVHGLLEELRLHDGAVPAGHYGFGVAIGGLPVRLHDLTVAYGALANDGRWRPARWFEDEPVIEGLPVLSPDHSRLVVSWLADPTARSPTFPRAGFAEPGFPLALKTGTSPDHRDSLAFGITGEHIVGVWVGHPDWRPMRGLSGYRGAGAILAEVVRTLGPPEAPLVRPPDGWSEHTVCALTGQRATPHCDTPRSEWFAPGRAPTHDCRGHRMHNGRVVVDLPARYDAWTSRHDLPTARPALATTDVVSLDILSPADATVVMADPDVPTDRSTLRLSAAVEPRVDEVVWWVDGTPFATVGYPYTVRWPIRPGRHTFSVQAANRPEHSRPVHVDAR